MRGSAGDLSPDGIRLITAAASNDGMVIIQQTMEGYGLSAGREEFMDGTARSAAKWRAIVAQLVNNGILEETSEGIYQLSAEGYEIADRAQALEEASKPTEITVNIAGSPDAQHLNIRSNRTLRLSQLEFLTSTEACVSSQPLSEEGKEIEAQLANDKIRAPFQLAPARPQPCRLFRSSKA